MLRLFGNSKPPTTVPPERMHALTPVELEWTAQRLMALSHAYPFTLGEAERIAPFMFCLSATADERVLTVEEVTQTPHALLVLRGQIQLDSVDSFGVHPTEIVQEGEWVGLSCLFGARAEDSHYRCLAPLRAAVLTRNALERLRSADAALAARCALMLAERLAHVVGAANRRQRMTALIAQSVQEELADSTYKHMKQDAVGRDFVHSTPSKAE
jgi:CRP-like cAMP-binding protein